MNRRDLFKFLAGIGLGAVTIETYERLYHIPMLETMFRKELEYWINQYNTAREEVERLIEQQRKREDEISSLRSDLTKSKEELEHLIQQYNTTKEEVSRLSEKLKQSEEEINNLKEKASYWETQYNTTKEEVGRLNSTINKIDELERESTSAIAYYRERMNEAIRKLKETIEKYRALLGGERVSFESSTVKILEDLKITQEKLQKVLPYFPLILKFYWKPTKIINDKIYDINVTFEVASPLNSLREVEVMLIPVEYRYFITKYGMREEDYNKVFPKEEVRSIKIKPRNLEREMFSVDLEDLKGGREYIVKARVEDVAGNEKTVEVRTPYVRQFENLGKELYEKGTIVAATYYPLYPNPHPWEWLEPMNVHPIYGKYNVTDPIIVAKTIDVFSGHGGNTLFLDYGIFQEDQLNEVILQNIKTILNYDIFRQIRFSIMYELPARARRAGLIINDQFIYNDETDFEKLKIILEDFRRLSTLFNNDNFLKLKGKPVIYIYEGQGVRGDVSKFFERIRECIKSNTSLQPYIVVDYATPLSVPPWQPYPTDPERLERALNVEGWTAWWAGYYLDRPEREYFNNFEDYVENGYKIWSMLSRENSRDFITSILPGWVDLRHPESHVPLPRDLDRFKKLIEIALSYSNSPEGNFKKFIRIDTYNEWGESTGIEPTIEEGMSYLNTLKSVLIRYLSEP